MCMTDPFIYPQVKNKSFIPLGIGVYSLIQHCHEHYVCLFKNIFQKSFFQC
jgi:hypothetical protein